MQLQTQQQALLFQVRASTMMMTEQVTQARVVQQLGPCLHHLRCFGPLVELAAAVA
jgi:hypothetical protein